MKNQCFLYVFVILLTVSTTYGQRVPYGLRLDKVQKEIIEKVAGFDSLIFIDKASYYNEDLIIAGLGFIENKVKTVKIYFSKDTNSFYDIKIKKIKTKQVKETEKKEILKNSDFFIIENIDNDSLNLKSRNKIYEDISHQPTWSVLIIKKKTIILKQAYSPEIYQNIVPTKERELFIGLVKKIEDLIK